MFFFLWVLQVILTPTHLAIVMEYASGGELFDRISNAGRFNEDEVINLALLWYMSGFQSAYLFGYVCHARPASFSSNLYLESVTAILWYQNVNCVSISIPQLRVACDSRISLKCQMFFFWSKYVTGTWNWKIHFWMAVKLPGWRYVILDIPR